MTITVQDKLKYAYGAFALCVIACAIPQMTVQTFAMVFSLILIIALYVMRSKFKKESFEHQEISQLIKTFWIWSLLYVVGIMVAGLLISSFGDMTLLNEWTQGVVEGTIVPNEDDLRRVTQEYMSANMSLIISTTLASIFPSLAYAFIRCKKALYRIENPVTPAPEEIIG